jgi:TolB protein
VLLASVVAGALLTGPPAGADTPSTPDQLGHPMQWVSSAYDGAAGNNLSQTGALSADSHYGVYASLANNLVEGDTDGFLDVFLRDMMTGKVLRVSRSTTGGPANGDSGEPEISADGRVVVFCSGASNLVPGDTNGRADIFVYRVATQRIKIASVDRDGGPTDGDSCSPSISANGRYIAFESDASDLATGDDNGRLDIYLSKVRTGKNTLASHTPDGSVLDFDSQDSSVSGNGRFVSYHSYGELVPDDDNSDLDVFVYDRRTDRNMRASSTPDGSAGDGGSARADLSDDGRFVVYHSSASDLVEGDTNDDIDVFRTSIRTGRSTLVTVRPDGGPVDGDSINPSVNGNGRYVTFGSRSPDHMPDLPITNATIFVRDLDKGKTRLVSKHLDGSPTTSGAYDPSISGRFITFSTGDRLTSRDTNTHWDIYRYLFVCRGCYDALDDRPPS